MVHLDPSSLRETRWYEYATRFLFGGLITAAAGVIGKKLGPGVGGLFLAFPANPARQRDFDRKTSKGKKTASGSQW
ncbi:MAG: hypothetical protein ACLQVG_19460 [Terriglobia bacterium]